MESKRNGPACCEPKHGKLNQLQEPKMATVKVCRLLFSVSTCHSLTLRCVLCWSWYPAFVGFKGRQEDPFWGSTSRLYFFGGSFRASGSFPPVKTLKDSRGLRLQFEKHFVFATCLWVKHWATPQWLARSICTNNMYLHKQHAFALFAHQTRTDTEKHVLLQMEPKTI